MIKKILSSIGFLAVSTISNAAIIDLGDVTRDTSTGLDWLDVTSTSGLSVTEVLAEMEVGGSLEGWRYATATQLDQLISNFGFTPATPCAEANTTNCSLSQDGDDPVIETMIRTLGDTYAPTISGVDFSSGAGDTIGFLLDDISISGPEYSVAWIMDYEFSDSSRQYDFDDSVWLTGGSSASYKGSFLVSSPVSVPAPATIWLLGSGIFGMARFSRKKPK